MNREIKFRVWDKENKLMFPHTLIDQYDKDGFMLWGDIFSGQDKTVELMQFTGLKDNNGKEIYEGDIVRSVCDKLIPKKTSEENMFKLPVFEKKTFHNVIDWYDGIRISGWRIKGNRFQAQLKWSTVGNMQLEVIGNIYENPELLVKESTE